MWVRTLEKWARRSVGLGLVLVTGCTLESVPLLDLDGDGRVGAEDCNDADPAVGVVYLDRDGDSWGVVSADGLCPPPSAVVAIRPGDCDDGQPFVNPGEQELCNARDDDCDQEIDEGLIQFSWYDDSDDDGYGDEDTLDSGCSLPDGVVEQAGDCNDRNSLISPEGQEVCDEQDNNCDGQVDEGVSDASSYWPDEDRDGYGALYSSPVRLCALVSGFSDNSLDCNDQDGEIHPGVAEQCDGVDQDCDERVDEDPSIGTLYYLDQDRDGYGVNSSTQVSCPDAVPAGYALLSGDCNDARSDIYPGAPEVCDQQDQDCDGETDEGLPLSLWYQDGDADGYGADTMVKSACIAPEGYVAAAGDCDDTNSAAFPGASEQCNGADESCDGVADEGFADGDSSGHPDCYEVAIVISQGFRDFGGGAADCYGVPNVNAEVNRIVDVLATLGISSVLFYDTDSGIKPDLLSPYALVIYNDGGWADLISTTTLNGLLDLRLQGKPLLFIGDDLANQAQIFANNQNDARTFFTLLWLSKLSAGGTAGRAAVAVDFEHPVMRGAAGLVDDFAYYGDMDLASRLNDVESVLMVVNGSSSPAVLAAEAAGQRTVVLLPGIFASVDKCPVSDGNGLQQLERLFKNAVTWLMESVDVPAFTGDSPEEGRR